MWKYTTKIQVFMGKIHFGGAFMEEEVWVCTFVGVAILLIFITGKLPI
jgi:hypothetical protein